MLQGVSYLMAKLEPSKKDQWSRPMRDTMATWLRGQDNITYTEKVCRLTSLLQLVVS
jgi:hypothetical protein